MYKIHIKMILYGIALFILMCFFGLQELYDSLEKLRPNLFRLASDTDEKDNEAISMSWFILFLMTYFK